MTPFGVRSSHVRHASGDEHPTRSTGPKPASHLDNDAYPARVTGNDSTPRTPPLVSSAAATWVPRCVSTPPSRWLLPSLPLSTVQGVARTSRERDRVEPAAGAAGSVTLQNGACLVPAPRPSRQAPQPTRYDNQSDPTTGTGERSHRQTQADGPITGIRSLTGRYGVSRAVALEVATRDAVDQPPTTSRRSPYVSRSDFRSKSPRRRVSARRSP